MLDLAPARVRRLAAAGLVAPKRGESGEYSFDFVDLVVLRTARDLLQDGVPFAHVRRALQRLRDNLPDDRSLTELRIGTANNRVVVREEQSVWEAETRQLLLDFEIYELADALPPLLDPRPTPPPPEVLDAGDWYDLGCELEPTSAEEAAAAYRRAIAADPDHVDAHVNLGRLMHEAEDLETAEMHYRRALELRSSDLTARFNLGVALEDLGRLPEARNAYRETVLADPNHADAHYNLAGVFERLGQRNRAVKHLQAYRRLVAAGWESDERSP
ncbi:MAG: tetratricopeptide repeat protein [Acidobacteria bacterium]|nr:tetratricopeptide repeat protein [Acidobacteriota bacterium]